jgi:hypothetical protein
MECPATICKYNSSGVDEFGGEYCMDEPELESNEDSKYDENGYPIFICKKFLKPIEKE